MREHGCERRRRSNRLGLLGAAAAVLCALGGSAAAGGEWANEARLRRPAALALTDDGRRLLAANAASGTISEVDLATRQVSGEFAVGEKLVDLKALGGDRFLATDEAAHQLVLLQWRADGLAVLQRLPVSPYPVAAAISADASRAYVSSLWSRRLTVVEIAGGQRPELRVRRVFDLDFPPRTLKLIQGDAKLVIGDAFVGRLAVFDTAAERLEISRDFFGHNVRGLAESRSGKMLLVSHQMLNELAHTVRNDVHWGLLMSNDLRWLQIDALLDENAVLYAGGHMHPVGEANDAAADPNAVAIAADGTAVLTLGGVNQIGVGGERDFRLERYPVGRRPTDVVIAADGTTAVIANSLDDSISLFDLTTRTEAARIPLGPMPELSLAEQGELLFYDGSLSLEGWMSCHSCHTDGHSGGLLNDNSSDGSFGAPKRVLSLLGAADTAPYAWNGQVATLHEQIENSVNHTMQRTKPPSPEQVDALAAYLATLELPPSVDQLRGTADPAAIARGRELFAARRCDRCHAEPHYTTPKAYDVGLHDQRGNRRFNPPSLRGASHRRAFFHDSRATELEEVFQVHGHQLSRPLEEQELRDLIAFLRSL